MKQDRISGIALIAGTLGAMITMGLHPIGGHLKTDAERLLQTVQLARGVHILGVGSICMIVVGFLGLAKAIGINGARVRAGFVAFALSWIAVLGAAITSGLVGSELVEQYQLANAAERVALHAVWDYNRHISFVLDRVFIAATCVGMVFWSLVLFRYDSLWKAAAILGLVIAALGLVCLFAGYIRIEHRLSQQKRRFSCLLAGIWQDLTYHARRQAGNPRPQVVV